MDLRGLGCALPSGVPGLLPTGSWLTSPGLPPASFYLRKELSSVVATLPPQAFQSLTTSRWLLVS